ncbi:uncharacterized protein LOC134211972 isoform X2 [Armigeres subalbatus]|uniref:uncharacterized protein LOC134211972 isoform X2 n=1 Tax=Armigeres subalbatus TaxID=124917 RepID=UPI002ED3A595
MWWLFHVLWLIIVIGLFFLILRRIYYFGMRGTEQQYETRDSQDIRSNQPYYIFTIYDSQQNARSQQASDPRAPNNQPVPPPPQYDDVIKSPELYQKPPSYNQVQ